MTATADFDAIIVGAGAAGMFAAMFAAQGGRRVALLDHAARPGNKILISGGGRCNFTNLHCRPQNFLSQNPHFAKSALARYTPADFIALVERHNIAYHEKTLGQLFCDGSARQIVTMLESELNSAGVHWLLNTTVAAVHHHGERFDLSLASPQDGNSTLRGRNLVVATGGLSIPKMGATSLGYDLARQFHLPIVDTRPALVPLLFNEADTATFGDLSGIAADAVVRAGGAEFRERLLFTHRGLSGPAVLQASSYWAPGQPVVIDMAPGSDATARMRSHPANRNADALARDLRAIFPQRLAERWVEHFMPADGTNRALLEFEAGLHAWNVFPAGTEGYAKAEVTAGGVSTDSLDAKTMECRNLPGLYFIGEVVDVTGHLGGHNFQWAWASGAACGRAIAAKSN